jgi:hypothetical protein
MFTIEEIYFIEKMTESACMMCGVRMSCQECKVFKIQDKCEDMIREGIK